MAARGGRIQMRTRPIDTKKKLQIKATDGLTFDAEMDGMRCFQLAVPVMPCARLLDC